MTNLVSGIIGAIGGAVIGAFSSISVAVWLRNSDKWKLFEEEVGIIKSKFLLIDGKGGIENVARTHDECLRDLSAAVCRVRPYAVQNATRKRLALLLIKYRDAHESKKGGFLPIDLAGNYKNKPGDLFSDPVQAQTYLIKILDDMTEL